MDKLPLDIVKHILLYDNRFVIRNDKNLQINNIQKNQLIIPPKKYEAKNDTTYICLTINKHKDYVISYYNYEIQIKIFIYSKYFDTIYQIESNNILLT